MTDQIIAAAKDDRDRRDAIKARLFDGIYPAAALAAALDLLLVREEDVDGLRADVRRLTDERDQARCAARDNAHQHQRLLDASGEADRLAALLATAEDDAEKQRRAACNLRDALGRVATAAGVSDGSGDEVADRIVEAIDKLRSDAARPALTVEILEAALTPSLQHRAGDVAAVAMRHLGAFARLTADAPTKPETRPVATVKPAQAPPAKPAPRYAPSPIDHLLGPFAKDRYVAVPAAAAKDVPPDRVLWRGTERHASRDADALNRGDYRRDFYGWGDDSTPEFPRWAVVDRGEPIGEEG